MKNSMHFIENAQQISKLLLKEPLVKRPRRIYKPKFEFHLPHHKDIIPINGGAIINGTFFYTKDLPQACADFLREKT